MFMAMLYLTCETFKKLIFNILSKYAFKHFSSMQYYSRDFQKVKYLVKHLQIQFIIKLELLILN